MVRVGRNGAQAQELQASSESHEESDSAAGHARHSAGMTELLTLPCLVSEIHVLDVVTEVT